MQLLCVITNNTVSSIKAQNPFHFCLCAVAAHSIECTGHTIANPFSCKATLQCTCFPEFRSSRICFQIISSMQICNPKSRKKEKIGPCFKRERGKFRILRTNNLINCVDETKHFYNRDSHFSLYIIIMQF